MLESASSEGPVSAPDVAALWDWSYDEDFMRRLARACAARNLRFASFHGPELEAFAHRIEAGLGGVRMALDRVTDEMPGLIYHLMRLRGGGAHIVNDPERMVWCRDKATMHLELLTAGVRVPYGVVLSTEDHPEQLEILELAPDRLGTPFVIKPAEGGGGDGVVLDARSPRDVSEYVGRMGRGKVVLQRKVLPRRLGSRRAWFRVFWVLGEVYPCWWDDRTHVYDELSSEDESLYGLGELRTIVALIARVSGMHLFTTEVAMDEDDRLVAVDFVNEMPDLRPQSGHPDGVPDGLLDRLAARLADRAAAGGADHEASAI
jgi:hypothetical protein